MKIRLVYSPSRLPGNPLFGTPIPAKPRIVPFFSSLAGHVLAIAALTSFVRFDVRYQQKLEERARDEHVIEVILEDPKLLVPARPSGGETSAASAGAKGPEAPKHSGSEALPKQAAVGEGKPKTYRQFQFEVPELPKMKRSEHQTILQPDLPPELAIRSDVRLPTEIFLSPTPKISPPLKQFVAPARRQTLSAGQGVQVPVLDTPNFEVKASDLKIADRIWNREAHLPKPAGTTSPVRVNLLDDNIPQLTASTTQSGDPLNLISIPDRPVPPVKGFVVPQGNEVALSGGAGSGTVGTSNAAAGVSNGVSTGAPGVSSNPNANGTSAGGPGKGHDRGDGAGGKLAGAGNGTGPDSATGTGGGGNGNGFGRGNAVAGNGTGSTGSGIGAGNGGTGAGVGAGGNGGNGGNGKGGTGTGTGSSPLSIPGVKTITRPRDGNYEVVIVQSSSVSVPGTSGVLTGRPVYTVYLQVDGPKDWILQYCVPREDNGPRTSGSVVKLGNPAPLKAPFPYLMIRPAAALAMEVRYLIVHGFVGPTGKFERLAIVGESDPAKETMLGLLQQWEFRPALKDGQPITVEVLLVIPKEAA